MTLDTTKIKAFSKNRPKLKLSRQFFAPPVLYQAKFCDAGQKVVFRPHPVKLGVEAAGSSACLALEWGE